MAHLVAARANLWRCKWRCLRLGPIPDPSNPMKPFNNFNDAYNWLASLPAYPIAISLLVLNYYEPLLHDPVSPNGIQMPTRVTIQ